MKPLVIYHASCADGAGAAFAAWCKFGEEAEYKAAKYGDPPPTDEEVRGREVYVLDFSYPLAVLHLMVNEAMQVTVIDHHKTAMEAYRDAVLMADHRMMGRPKIRLFIDMNKSGAVLAWEHFHPNIPVPEVLLYIQDRDLWQWKLPRSKEISAALWMHNVGQDFLALRDLTVKWDEGWIGWRDYTALIAEGATILRVNEQYIEAQARHAEVVEWPSSAQGHWRDGLRCLAANATVLHSEAGNVLAERSKVEGLDPMAIVWSYDGTGGLYRVSLRSVGDFDVSAIAKNFGGGGHKNAAGFECKELPWRRMS